MGYDSTVKKNEIISFGRKWMELEIIMLSKINQVWKNLHVESRLNIVCVCVYMCAIKHLCSNVILDLHGRDKEEDGEGKRMWGLDNIEIHCVLV
jgi:hypothetical protein